MRKMIKKSVKGPNIVTMEFTVATVSGYRPVIGRLEEDKQLAKAFANFNKQRHPQRIDEENKVNRTLNEFRKREMLNEENKKSDVFSNAFVPKKYSKSSKEYGRPPPGSLTEMRAKKAAKHVAREMLQVCEVIEEYGRKGVDGRISITFGELFKVYQNISDKIVGMLLRARKHKMLEFEGEMLYQRRDEEKVIMLNLKHDQIKSMINAL